MQTRRRYDRGRADATGLRSRVLSELRHWGELDSKHAKAIKGLVDMALGADPQKP